MKRGVNNITYVHNRTRKHKQKTDGKRVTGSRLAIMQISKGVCGGSTGDNDDQCRNGNLEVRVVLLLVSFTNKTIPKKTCFHI